MNHDFRYLFVLLSGLLIVHPLIALDFPPNPLGKAGYALTFNDEFDDTVLDSTKWFIKYRAGLRNALNSFKPDSVYKRPPYTAKYVSRDGVLRLRIDTLATWVSSIQTSDYTYDKARDTCIRNDKFVQKYGYWEIRSRMPKGAGLCSAYWLLHADPYGQEYLPPDSLHPGGISRTDAENVAVEIDIFEQKGNSNSSNMFTVHMIPSTTGRHTYNYAPNFDYANDFHIWGFDWKEGELNWYLDNVKIHTYRGLTPQKEMLLFLGLYASTDPASWYGALPSTTLFPKDFQIDYIRIYRDSTRTSVDNTVWKNASAPRLLNISPNPFNPSTIIQFSIPGKEEGGAPVILDIFSSQGKLVRTLVKDLKTGGNTSFMWDGRNMTGSRLAGGIYMCRLRHGMFSSEKRIALIK